MKHRIGYNRLGRKASHRKALIKNQVTQLLRHERITTTKAKALETRKKAEKMITKAKVDTVHHRRIVAKTIQDKAILAKLFNDIGKRFIERPGGYTRILKLGYRKGDAAELVILELVEGPQVGTDKSARKDVKKGGKKPAEPNAPKKEEPVDVVAATTAISEEEAEIVKE